MGICSAKIDWNLKPTPICFFTLALVLSCSEALAGNDWFEPNPTYTIIPPMQSGAFNVPPRIKGVAFNLTECRYVSSTYPLFQKPLRINEVSRTVTVSTPKSIDISDSTIVNSLVVSAWYYAWNNCFAWVNGDRRILADFSGVRVLVLQENTKIIDVGRTLVSSNGTISSSSFFHVLFEQRRLKEDAAQKALLAAQDAERQRQMQLSEQEQAAHWSFIKFIFWLACGSVVFLFGARHIPKTLAYLRYMLSPHPAIQIINRATQGSRSVPVNGNQLADALRNKPMTSTETILSTRDINASIVRTKEEIEFLHAKEELALRIIDMESARARLEEIMEDQGKS